MANKNLTNAKNAKNDEFYTMLSDIENELKYYRDQFKGKVVLCNCDDPYESNFFKYFAMNFNLLGLKKLISTCYDGSCISYVDLLADVDESAAKERKAYKVEITKVYDANGDGGTDLRDVKKLIEMGENKLTLLKGNGDFASEECLEILKEADIVVTNPPFSKFRDYVKVLMDYNKKFLIIGNQNAVTYKEIFPYIKDGKLRMGHSMNGSNRWFTVPDNYEAKEGAAGYKIENGKKMLFVNGVAWFTNLKTHKADNPLPICRKYKGNEDEYPHYDNYDAINVDKINNFPYDLAIGQVAGVPITIVYKIADDGLIYFDDCGMADGVQKYDVIGHEHDLNESHDSISQFLIGGGASTSESLSSVSDNRCERDCENRKVENEGNLSDKGQRFCNKRGAEICENSYQAYKIVWIASGHTKTTMPKEVKDMVKFNPDIKSDMNTGGYGIINGHQLYHRILIQRIK